MACVKRWKKDAVKPSPFSPPYPETPSANIMYPIGEMVEYASTRLISVCVQAITAANMEENTPMYATRSSAAGHDRANTGNNRPTRYTPATTIVAAWINAETGVGPSIASGNQM